MMPTMSLGASSEPLNPALNDFVAINTSKA
jgi:hypothetical protein